MAPAPLRWLIRALVTLVAALAVLVAGYPLAGWIGSSLPRNGDFEQAQAGVTIMVETNDTHTGIVVPVANLLKDWRETFPSASQPRPQDGLIPTHLAIGWGEREVFLNVPTWGDLSPATALRIMLVGGEPLMRVSHYVNPQPGPNHRPLRISQAQYARLVERIEAGLQPPPPGGTREILRGSYQPDAYYPATGTYTLLTTCNTWVGDTLAAAGIAMGAWTPFAGGVMKWIPETEETA